MFQCGLPHLKARKRRAVKPAPNAQRHTARVTARTHFSRPRQSTPVTTAMARSNASHALNKDDSAHPGNFRITGIPELTQLWLPAIAYLSRPGYIFLCAARHLNGFDCRDRLSVDAVAVAPEAGKQDQGHDHSHAEGCEGSEIGVEAVVSGAHEKHTCRS